MEVEEVKVTTKINLFLHKHNIKSYEDCIDTMVFDNLTKYTLKSSTGLSGNIYVHNPVKNTPAWQNQLNQLSVEEIILEQNTTNKAVVVFKHINRFFSITFGYGKSILDESTIERNFGLKTSVNLIDAEKIKSLNTVTMEEAIISTQKQSSTLSNQNTLQVDTFRDIAKSISGTPLDENMAKFIVGGDSLIFTGKMDITKIKEKVDFVYKAYKSDKYKEIGFGWLDNIKLINDKESIEKLDEKLKDDILDDSIKISISPNRIIDWGEINGLYLTGINHKEEGLFEIDSKKYLDFIKANYSDKEDNIIGKLKRDSLMAIIDENEEGKVSSVYKAITTETNLNDITYVFIYGDWFEIENEYYEFVNKFIDELPIATFNLPHHDKTNNETEEEYNKRVSSGDPDLCLMDQKFYQGKGYGKSKIESCDIVSKNSRLIHVKKHKGASDLSHLFAQGVVSAEVLSNDEDFKKFINEQVFKKFKKDIISESTNNNEIEIVFGLIKDREFNILSEFIPFFSKVNLMIAINRLKALKYKYSIMAIESR